MTAVACARVAAGWHVHVAAANKAAGGSAVAAAQCVFAASPQGGRCSPCTVQAEKQALACMHGVEAVVGCRVARN